MQQLIELSLNVFFCAIVPSTKYYLVDIKIVISLLSRQQLSQNVTRDIMLHSHASIET